MKIIGPKANSETWPHGRPFASEIPKLRKLASSQSLTGLANDTKWKNLVVSIGFEFKQGKKAFRIFGYSPKDCTDFYEKENTSVQN